MIEIVTCWEEFEEKWDGGRNRQNFLLRGEMFPFGFETPPLAEVIEAVRHDENTRILKVGSMHEITMTPFPEFRDLPIEDALQTRASVAHFESRVFAGEGGVFANLNQVFDGWYRNLGEHGFSWDEESAQRAFFYSGANCNTGYHFDSSYVLACQVVGRKRFCWLKDPSRWCPRETLLDQADYYDRMKRPPGITDDDVIECEMLPGDVLWNIMLTPHWVYALDEPTYSFNLTHFRLRHNGELSAISHELDEIHAERRALAA